MAWMIACKKFPYAGIMNEPGQRFYMPEADDLYRRLFIMEGKAKDDEELNRPREKTIDDCEDRFRNATDLKAAPFVAGDEGVVGPQCDPGVAGAEIETRDLREEDDPELLLEPKRGRYNRRDMRSRR